MSRALVEDLFPQLRPQTVIAIEEGWDSLVLDVDGEWIVRIPRRDQVREWLRTEISLLPELAATLPAPIPHFEHVNGLRAVAYRKLPGSPADTSRPQVGRDLGRFLAALHAFPVERSRELGAPSHDVDWRERYRAFADAVLARADQLLGDDREAAHAMVDEFLGDDANFAFAPRLVHADLGPEHVLCDRDKLTGVIDWGDVRIGDPALDFSWALHGTSPDFASAVLDEYGRDDASLAERALFFHRLGPWYHLHYGLYFDQPAFVESGLAGVRSRLPRRIP
jgi:aminoglycoside phosphotransferase (APT) family kinase protein